jgi:SAM-dependent methyltransferase
VKLNDLIAYAGHEIHIVRRREVLPLLDLVSEDLHGQVLLDVAGGDGYWASKALARGARAVALDINGTKLVRGKDLSNSPDLVQGDALTLPFKDDSFDIVMSICAIEHFDDGKQAIAEMTRVLRPGGDLLLSADTLSREQLWPALSRGHRRRYHVVQTYSHEDLGRLFADNGVQLLRYRYIFRDRKSERLYLQLSRLRVAWNLAAPLGPIVRSWDRRAPNERGSVVLVHGRKV